MPQNLGSTLNNINTNLKEKDVKHRANSLNMPYIDIANVYVNPDVMLNFEYKKLVELNIIPFYKLRDSIRFAIADPDNKEIEAYLKSLSDDKKVLITTFLASDNGISSVLKANKPKGYEKASTEHTIDKENIGNIANELSQLEDLKDKIESTNSIEGLNTLNIGALKLNASDMHFQPEDGTVLVRFRIDGILYDVFELDAKTYEGIKNQIKFKARLKMNLSVIPQDGRYFIKVNNNKVDIRVSLLPTEYGETIVQRLLSDEVKTIEFDKMGFSEHHISILNSMNNVHNGMILATGPTGSGKTTTLYSILNHINSSKKKIITLEDPIEYHLKGISQSQINEKQGYSFASGLESILRQDPDIIMVGEIRDLDTAQTAIQAALTGHTLLSTLHTNNAVATVARLLNMGLPPYMIGPSMHTVIAQRLVRNVCMDCAVDREITESEKEDISKILKNQKFTMPDKLKVAKGCTNCSDTGYIGQMVVAEILQVTDDIQELILKEALESDIHHYVEKKGMITMMQDAVLKVISGKTTLQEVYRVLK